MHQSQWYLSQDGPKQWTDQFWIRGSVYALVCVCVTHTHMMFVWLHHSHTLLCMNARSHIWLVNHTVGVRVRTAGLQVFVFQYWIWITCVCVNECLSFIRSVTESYVDVLKDMLRRTACNLILLLHKYYCSFSFSASAAWPWVMTGFSWSVFDGSSCPLCSSVLSESVVTEANRKLMLWYWFLWVCSE